MPDAIRSARAGEIVTLTIDRPDAGNRLTNPMLAAIVAALDGAANARVIVLRGAGADFCLGREIEPPAPGSGVNALDILRDDAGPVIALYEALRRRRQPIVGLVQGRAWGLGLVLAAACDVTLAADDSSFRLRELGRGIPPCIAMAPLLDRMPVKAIGHLVYSAEEAGANWAQQAGIVSQVVPARQLETQGDAAVERLLSFPDEAVRTVKQFLASAPRFNEVNAALYGASLLSNVLGSR
jgi:enoyl-CoA hydratase/carnithine racemase